MIILKKAFKILSVLTTLGGIVELGLNYKSMQDVKKITEEVGKLINEREIYSLIFTMKEKKIDDAQIVEITNSLGYQYTIDDINFIYNNKRLTEINKKKVSRRARN